MALITLDDVHAAEQRLTGVATRTGLHRLDLDRVRALGFPIPVNLPDIYLKAESEQPIGSFKLRGAYNKIASLTPQQRQAGVVAHSSGNHAQGVAYAARALGCRAIIVMPENAPRVKRDATLALGAEVLLCGPTSADRIRMADDVVSERGGTLIPPFNDDLILAGQGTCGLEILHQFPDVDTVIVPVSGGGLLGGIATAAKLTRPAIQVWGAEPELAGDAAQSFRENRRVEWPGSQTTKTIADGLRSQSLGERNFAHIMAYADGILTVTEDEILDATRILLTATTIPTEPSGAVALALALFHADALPSARNTVCIVSGGNIDPALRTELLRPSDPA